ncbi:MAG TPA: branched-chain amino acid ABC transporter permease [Mycobacteriales bacterium]|nr:branched-chain amino acid ABC transporter permease [Mycobacteriales bacterium]
MSAPTEVGPPPAPAPGKPRRPAVGVLRWTLARHLLLVVVGLVVMFIVTAALPEFRDFQVMEIGYFVCAVAGLTVLTGMNGQLSLGHGALMLIGAYVVALLQVHAPSTPMYVQLVAAVLVTAAFGAVLGAGAARLRGPYLAGATLALAVGLPSIPTHYVSSLGGETGLNTSSIVTVPGWLGASFTQDHYLAWIGSVAAIATLLMLGNLRRSGVGRHFRAIRDDEVAARLSGLNVARTQVLAFVVSAGCAGLAGGLTVLATNSASPGGFDLTLSVGLLTAVILGGLGSLAGAVVGSVAIVALPSLSETLVRLTSLSASRGASVELGIYGLVLIAVMLVAPGGLAGVVRRLRATVARP